MRSPELSMRFLQVEPPSRNIRDAGSSSHLCRPAPPTCRRTFWASTRSLHPSAHKKPRARAIEALSSIRCRFLPVLRSDQRGWDRMVSSFLRTQKQTTTLIQHRGYGSYWLRSLYKEEKDGFVLSIQQVKWGFLCRRRPSKSSPRTLQAGVFLVTENSWFSAQK